MLRDLDNVYLAIIGIDPPPFISTPPPPGYLRYILLAHLHPDSCPMKHWDGSLLDIPSATTLSPYESHHTLLHMPCSGWCCPSVRRWTER